MSNDQQQIIIPHIRTLKIENIPRIKISLLNDISNLEVNRILIPIESPTNNEQQIENSVIY
jgi:hypothetical protein